jgi:hypothetical protein
VRGGNAADRRSFWPTLDPQHVYDYPGVQRVGFGRSIAI